MSFVSFSGFRFLKRTPKPELRRAASEGKKGKSVSDNLCKTEFRGRLGDLSPKSELGCGQCSKEKGCL